jgi:beta-lactamase superfamily II metal-dependent hydrolase
VRVILFDVGHGFCAFLKSESGSTLLIDCGSSEKFSPVKYILKNKLHDAVPVNGKFLTEFIVSHPHDDHIKDISRVIEELPPYLLLRNKFKWDEVKNPGTDPSKYENLDIYSSWQESYSARPTLTPNWGRMVIQTFKLPQVLVAGSNNSKAVNNSSFAVIVTFNGTRYTQKLLFGGDLEESGWEALLKSNAEFRAAVAGTTFYFASHHGHKSGFSSELFKAMGRKPHLNLISVTDTDDSVVGSYSDNAGGIFFGTEQRFTLTTRSHGSIFIEVDDTGYATVSHGYLPDNVKPEPAIPNYIASFLSSFTLPPESR